MVEVLIIAVIYNTPDEALRFLRSIERCNFSSLKVVLVDNSDKGNDSLVQEIKKINVDINYMKSPENLGYFGGADYGLKYFLKENALPAWILVNNVDIVFDRQDFFQKLVTTQWPDNTGVVAPAIISHKWKTDTNPKIVTRYSGSKMKFYKLVCTNMLTQNAYMTLSYLKKKLSGSKNSGINNKESGGGGRKLIYAAHGSCMVFSRKYFEKGGNLQHISFLFGEEIFVAETALSLNLETVYDPELIVSDFEHASTGFFYSRKIAAYMKQSTLDIIEHYYKES